jgi:tagatose-1,6-bisphosphate aldolase
MVSGVIRGRTSWAERVKSLGYNTMQEAMVRNTPSNEPILYKVTLN